MGTPPVIPDLSLLRRIGGGSYGDVWIARTITGVYRAVKVVDKARFSDDRPYLRELDGITRFQRLVGDQPRQLALMHVGRLEERGIFYYVMELADDVDAGTDIDPEKYQPLTLKALHEKRPVLPASEVIRIGSELARSLLGLHTAGLIHRDVKPSNIIFVAGVPKLADIGLVSSSDHTLTSLGTPGYSPPEGAGTERADIYSLGKILYQLATGLHTDEFPKLPNNVAGREDAQALLELNEVFLKACQPDPNDRYPSAQAMLDELMLLHAGKSVKELNETRERLKTLGRAALWLGAAAALVIAVLGVKNYFAVRALVAQEQQARIQAETNEQSARYTSDLHLAQFSLASGDVGQVRASLRRQIPAGSEPDLRGPEWFALWNDAAGDDVHSLGAIGGPAIGRVVATRDGKTIVAIESGETREVVVWDSAGSRRRSLATAVRDIGGFSPDESRVLIGRVDRTIAWVDLRSGAVTELPAIVGRLFAMSGDGRVLAVGESSEGAVLVRVWLLDTAPKEIGRWSGAELAKGAAASAVALDERGQAMALALFWPEGLGRTRELRVVEVATGATRFVRTDLGRWDALAFSGDGLWLAAGGVNQPVTVLGAVNGSTVHSFAGHEGVVRAVAFDRGDRHLISAGEDLTLRVWALRGDEPAKILRGHEASVMSLGAAGDARVVSAGSDGTIRLWDPGAPPRVMRAGGFWAGTLGDFSFGGPDGRLFISAEDGRIVTVDRATLGVVGEPLPAFHPLGVLNGQLHAVDASHQFVELNPVSGALVERGLRPVSEGRITTIRASADLTRAALGFRDGGIEVWDLAKATSVRLAPPRVSTVWEMDIDPKNAALVAGYANGMLCRWDLGTNVLGQTRGDDSVAVTEVAYAPDGSAVGVGREDGRLSLVAPDTLAVVRTVRAHSRAINAIEFSPKGDRLFTGGADGFVIVWTYPDLRALAILQQSHDRSASGAQDGIYRLRLSPDGGMLVAMTEGGRLRRWLVR